MSDHTPQSAPDAASGAPPAYPRGSPMSPRPRMFNPPPNAPPPQPGVVRPSDLMTMEDYSRLRYTTTKKSIIGGLVGGIGSVVVVRQFWPRKVSPNALVLIGFGAGITSGIYSSASYLRSEIAKVSQRARDMSAPTAEDGSPLFTDLTSPDAGPAVVPTTVGDTSADYVNTGRIHTLEGDRWGKMGEGKDGEMRDPFFRPGVPRRDG